MLNLERVNYILQELREHNSATINELSKKYYVSPSTIRRDLNQLERNGYVHRTHGGAILKMREGNEIPYQLRENENKEKKICIAKQATRLIKDGMYIFMDATSTVAAMLPFLSGKKDLKIITNSLQIALAEMEEPNIDVFITGGWIHSITKGVVGEISRRNIQEFIPDIAFLGVRAISLENGLMGISEDTMYIKRDVIERCRQNAVLCDHTKLDALASRQIAPIEKIQCFITDSLPSDKWICGLSNRRIRLICPGHTD